MIANALGGNRIRRMMKKEMPLFRCRKRDWSNFPSEYFLDGRPDDGLI